MKVILTTLWLTTTDIEDVKLLMLCVYACDLHTVQINIL